MKRRIVSFFLVLIVLSVEFFVTSESVFADKFDGFSDKIIRVKKTRVHARGIYYDRDSIVCYIKKFNKLPRNFITKSEARSLGCIKYDGILWYVTNGKVIGGDIFENRELLVPEAAGRVWYECDLEYKGEERTMLRLLFSNDGLIYYTDDHYRTAAQIY